MAGSTCCKSEQMAARRIRQWRAQNAASALCARSCSVCSDARLKDRDDLTRQTKLLESRRDARPTMDDLLQLARPAALNVPVDPRRVTAVDLSVEYGQRLQPSGIERAAKLMSNAAGREL